VYLIFAKFQPLLGRAWRAIIARLKTSCRRSADIRISTQENWRTIVSRARAVRESAARENGDTSGLSFGLSFVLVERTPVAGSQDGLVGVAKSRRYE